MKGLQSYSLGLEALSLEPTVQDSRLQVYDVVGRGSRV